MDEVTDVMLLQRYAREGSEGAFSELVARHAGWVYGTALRVLRDRHLAEDVTQAVFVVLAEKAGELGGESLGPWLFRVTRYSCARALRDKGRRERREREAGAMRFSEPAGVEGAWERVAPVLDEMVGRLGPAAREAILLRFYQRMTLVEVGRSLGVSEDAARKRVGKAVGQLRKMFNGRGVVVPAAVLAGALTAGMPAAAPAGVVASCGAAAAAGKSAASASVIAKGAVVMMVGQKVKVAALGVVLALIPAGAGYVAWSHALASSAAGRRGTGASGDATAVARPVPVAAPATQASREAERRRIVQEMVACQGHMHAIGQGLLHWADRHQGKYPPDLGSLIREKAEGFTIDTFVCPATASKPPKDLTRDQQADWVNAHSEYVYVGAGLDDKKVDPEDVLVYEKRDDHTKLKLMNVLHGDRHTDAMSIAQFEQLIARSKARAAAGATTRP